MPLFSRLCLLSDVAPLAAGVGVFGRRFVTTLWFAALAAWTPAVAADFACGTPPSLQCVAGHMFRITKASHPDGWMRERAEIAETQIAPGNLAVAVEYFIDDNPDPPPWLPILYIARAGLFDQALSEARRGASPDERVGGLLAVAGQLAQAGAFDRAAAILTEAESQFASVTDSDYDHPEVAADTWARMGRFDDAVRVMPANPIRAMTKFLELAEKYPAQAADLRRRALAQAERDNTPHAWRLIAEDAAQRGDPETTPRAAQHALAGTDGLVDSIVRIAKALMKVGLREQAGKVMDDWRAWVGERNSRGRTYLIPTIIPVLVELGRDDDVDAAIEKLIEYSDDRSNGLSEAAKVLFSSGRPAQAARFELAAILINDHDHVLHNIALAQAQRGDLLGALEVASKIERKAPRRAALFAISRAIHGGARDAGAVPAINRLVRMAQGDANLLLEAASAMQRIGQPENAHALLVEAITLAGAEPSQNPDLAKASELEWRIEGTVDAVLAFLINITDDYQQSEIFAELSKAIAPSSPAAALELAGQISRPKNQIDALSAIAAALLAADKAKPN
ncbi:MAG: hypothetical protein WDO17_02460 [Alphaproteobacteria bacterium]